MEKAALKCALDQAADQGHDLNALMHAAIGDVKIIPEVGYLHVAQQLRSAGISFGNAMVVVNFTPIDDGAFPTIANGVCAESNAQIPPAEITDRASLRDYLDKSVPVMQNEYNTFSVLRGAGPVGKHFLKVIIPASRDALVIAEEAQQAADAGDWTTVQSLMNQLGSMDTLPDSERDWMFFHGMAECAQYLSNGTYYVLMSEVDASSGGVWFDRVQFFQGPRAAGQACTEDGIAKPWNGEQCNDYYVRNLYRPGSMLLSPSAQILDWHSPDGTVANPDQPITLDQLATTVNSQPGSALWKIEVKTGRIVRVEGVTCPN